MLEILILYLQATFKNSFSAIQDVHALAEQVKNGNTAFPSLYCTNDEYQPLSGNENFLYFRQLGAATESESDEESVSGCDHYVTRTYPMVAIAYIPKDIFKTDNAYIDSKVSGNIANILRVANYGTLMASMKADDIHAEVTRISTDRYEVWEQEFKGIDIAARFDHVLCAVEFDLVVSATESCLQNYDCNDETVTVEGDTIVVEISDSNAWHKDGDFLTEIKQIGSTNAVNWQLIHEGVVRATVTADGLNIPAIVGNVALTGNLVVTGSIDYTTGAIQSLNGLTDKTQLFAIGSAGTDFNLVSAAGVHTFNIPDAGVGITGGLVNNAAQTFEGVKTFASAPILTGFTQGSVLFAGVGGVVSQDNANLFFDNVNNYLGLGIAVPTRTIHSVGNGVRNIATYTATTNNDYGWNYTGTLTARATASDTLNGVLINPTLVAGAATQTLIGSNLSYNFSNVGGHANIWRYGIYENSNLADYGLYTANGILVNFSKEIAGGIVNSTTRNRIVLYDGGSGHAKFTLHNSSWTWRFTNGNIMVGQDAAASARLHVVGSDATTANYVAKFYGFGLTNGPEIRNDAAMILGRLAADPASAINGMIYYNTTTNKFRGYEGGAWANLI